MITEERNMPRGRKKQEKARTKRLSIIVLSINLLTWYFATWQY